MNGRLFGGRPWVPALAIVPMFVGFVFVGAQAGLVIGTLTVVAIVVAAARADPAGPSEVAQPGEGVPGGILVVVVSAIEDPRTAGIVAAIGDPSRPVAGERGLLVLSPARSTRMDRWADDLERARFESQRVLAVSLATMAAAGTTAEGRVGDGDLVQAVEDTLRTYAASEVVVVAADGDSEKQIAELERRLERPVRRVLAESL